MLFTPLFQLCLTAALATQCWCSAPALTHRSLGEICHLLWAQGACRCRNSLPYLGWSCATLQEMCFESPHSKFLEADGHLTEGNLGSVVSKSFLNSFLLVGPGMLEVPSSSLLPPGTCVFWIFIFFCFFQGVENTFCLALCKDV